MLATGPVHHPAGGLILEEVDCWLPHERRRAFIAPGAMFLNLPTRNGTRLWKLATNYGIGYQLFDFGFGGGRRATLHLNIAKAWLLSDYSDVVTGHSMDFAGFSMTFSKDR